MQRNNLSPAAGAFTTPGQMPAPAGQPDPALGGAATVPQAVPQASDPAAFLEQLKGLGLLGNVPQGVPSAKSPGVPASAQPMDRPSLGSSLLSDPAMQPPRPQRKAKFEPGKPGQARSGMTAHQMMRDPDVIRTLHEKIAAWETEYPNRALMGSHIQQMLPDVSASQARTIKRMLDKARVSQATTSLEGLLQQGAASAMKKG